MAAQLRRSKACSLEHLNWVDALALKLPEITPAKTVGRFPAYLQELLTFDGVAAISEDSRQTLLDYWRWLEAPHPPPVTVIPLGIEPPPPSSARHAPSPLQLPVILSVGSLEGRKNHVALLDACERLWSAGTTFELRLIGLAHPQTGRAALEKIRALQAMGRPLCYDGPVDDATLEAAYAGCAFTVYPSLIEGFGLPVLESLARGKPCVCSGQGALGESARGGGCVVRIEEHPYTGLVTKLPGVIADTLLKIRNAETLRRLEWVARGRAAH